MTKVNGTATLALLIIFQTMKSYPQSPGRTQAGPSFAVTFETSRSTAPLDGRLLLLLSTNPVEEPRFQINDTPKSQIVFGLDVENWKPGEALILDAAVPGIWAIP